MKRIHRVLIGFGQALAITATWIVLAFLMIEHSLYHFGAQYTAGALIGSGMIVWFTRDKLVKNL